MRKTLWIIALALAFSASPRAQADSFTDYTINFMGPAGTLFPVSGTIVYDITPGALNPFATCTVKWDGETFDFSPISNQYNYLSLQHTPSPFYNDTTSHTGTNAYQILSGC